MILAMRRLSASSVGIVLAALVSACGGTTPTPDIANATPRARLAAPLYAPVGQPVTLDAGAAYDPDGALVAYTFSFSDGSPQATLPTAEVQHTFTIPGAFEVAVIVRDDGGLLARATQLVVVRNDPPACLLASDCQLGTECRTDHGLCYATGPGVGSGDAECETDEACGGGLTCRAGICLRAEPPAVVP